MNEVRTNKQRLTVEFTVKTAERLREIKDELELNSLVEVIRIAVKLLSFLLRETNDGWEIVLKKGDQQKQPVLMDTLKTGV